MKLILVMAVTADGKIARNSMELIDWTGKADKKYFIDVTRKAGVIIMGSKTFDTIGKVLPGRKNIVMTKNTERKSHNSDLIFTDQPAGDILKSLQEEGFEEAVLVGGSVINTLFAKENLIDEIHVTMVPEIFGRGLSLFNEPLDVRLKLLDVKKIDTENILFRYRVKK